MSHARQLSGEVHWAHPAGQGRQSFPFKYVPDWQTIGAHFPFFRVKPVWHFSQTEAVQAAHFSSRVVKAHVSHAPPETPYPYSQTVQFFPSEQAEQCGMADAHGVHALLSANSPILQLNASQCAFSVFLSMQTVPSGQSAELLQTTH